MKVRWTRLARADLANVQNYIATHNPAAARKVGARIRDAVERLESNPYLGRVGSWAPARSWPCHTPT
jgi:plasmid stabilization system protein ParE